MDTPLHWQVTHLRDRQLGQAADAWDALLLRTWGAHPLLDSRFVNGLLHHFGSGAEHLCVGHDASGQLAAMHVLRRRGAWRWASFAPMQAPVGLCLAPGPVGVKALLKALPGFVTQLDVLSYDSRFGDFGSNRPQPNTTWHALTTSIQLVGSFSCYWGARSNKLRQNMRRYERKLAELGPVRFVAVHAEGEMRAAVDRYAVLESTGWKGREGTALAPGSAQTAFYGDVLGRFAASGEAQAHELWAGGLHLASRLSVNAGGVIVMLKTTFDECHAAVSPGHILLARTIEHLFQHYPGQRIEFYTNATPEQRLWGTHESPIRHATFYRHHAWAVAGMLAQSIRSAGRTATRSVSNTALMSLQTRVISTVAALSPAAIALMDRAERTHGPSAGADWYRNLCEQVPVLGQHARFAVLHRADQPIAVLPLLMTGEARGAFKLGALANYYTALYAPAFDDSLTASELAVLLRDVRALLGQVTEFRFNPMDPHSREFTLLRSALLHAGFVIAPYFCFGNWTHRPQGTFDDYMAQRPGTVRTSHRRMPKRFAAAGGTLEIVTGGERLPAALAAYQRVYAASWKKPEPFPGFMPGLISTCAQRGWLRLGIAWLGGQPIAAQVWIVVHGRAEIYKLAYDEAYKSHAAGTVLTAHLMRHAIDEDRVQEIDYLIGDDEYKQSWMDRRQERWGLIGYNTLTLRGLAGSLTAAARGLTAPWRGSAIQAGDARSRISTAAAVEKQAEYPICVPSSNHRVSK